jgi:hypothetical protein
VLSTLEGTGKGSRRVKTHSAAFKEIKRKYKGKTMKVQIFNT